MSPSNQPLFCKRREKGLGIEGLSVIVRFAKPAPTRLPCHNLAPSSKPSQPFAPCTQQLCIRLPWLSEGPRSASQPSLRLASPGTRCRNTCCLPSIPSRLIRMKLETLSIRATLTQRGSLNQSLWPNHEPRETASISIVPAWLSPSQPQRSTLASRRRRRTRASLRAWMSSPS